MGAVTTMLAAVNHTRQTGTRANALMTAAVRAIGRLAFAALVVFHAWLLWTHLAQGKAFEPQTAMRWFVAVLVLAGFRYLSRRGLPLVFGRRAVVLWLLVVLIHGTAVWAGESVAADVGIPQTVTVLAQISVIAGTLGFVLWVAVAAASLRWRAGHPSFSVPVLIAGLPSAGLVFRFSPRPPPLA